MVTTFAANQIYLTHVANTYFLSKSAEYDVTLMSFSVFLEPRKIPSARMYDIDERWGMHSLVLISTFVFKLSKDKWGRGVSGAYRGAG